MPFLLTIKRVNIKTNEKKKFEFEIRIQHNIKALQ